MKSSHIASGIAIAALCGLTPAAAQTADQAGEQEIVVEAPRTVPSPPPATPAERSAYTGAPVVTTTVRITALYGDLDLSQPAQADRLMTRIERVARDACATLDRLFPLNPDPDCVDRAVAGATPATKAIIAAAQK
ncbi:MAG: UrcA family protein [Novosphingobium sp.]|jgi:UrcA family protein|nr:UrcA family protein [Novosphingobium sp.]